MKKLFLLLTVCASIYTVSLAGGASCNKDKKCCKSGSAQGKSCSKSSAEASTAETAPVTAADAAAAPANQAPAKSCCKGKKAACAHKEQ